MSQFTCPICGDGFEQRSRYERHLQTAHPPQAISAAEIEAVMAGVDFPTDRDGLLTHARSLGQEQVVAILEDFPEQEYRDAAEVARAFGEIRSHQPASRHQPSKLGGERGGAAALQAVSAAAVAKALSGVTFPERRAGLVRQAKANDAPEAVVAALEEIPTATFHDMAEVEQAFAASR